MYDELVEEFAIDVLYVPYTAVWAKLFMNVVIISPNVLICQVIIKGTIILDTLELWLLSFAAFVSHAKRC